MQKNKLLSQRNFLYCTVLWQNGAYRLLIKNFDFDSKDDPHFLARKCFSAENHLKAKVRLFHIWKFQAPSEVRDSQMLSYQLTRASDFTCSLVGCAYFLASYLTVNKDISSISSVTNSANDRIRVRSVSLPL